MPKCTCAGISLSGSAVSWRSGAGIASLPWSLLRRAASAMRTFRGAKRLEAGPFSTIALVITSLNEVSSASRRPVKAQQPLGQSRKTRRPLKRSGHGRSARSLAGGFRIGWRGGLVRT